MKELKKASRIEKKKNKDNFEVWYSENASQITIDKKINTQRKRLRLAILTPLCAIVLCLTSISVYFFCSHISPYGDDKYYLKTVSEDYFLSKTPVLKNLNKFIETSYKGAYFIRNDKLAYLVFKGVSETETNFSEILIHILHDNKVNFAGKNDYTNLDNTLQIGTIAVSYRMKIYEEPFYMFLAKTSCNGVDYFFRIGSLENEVEDILQLILG